nr:hypothetical protein [Tanacetum cinerariifolium]
MEDPNITMEDYIRLEEEKARRHDITLPPRDKRHQYLRFEGLEYTDADIADFDERDIICGGFHGTTPSYTSIRDLMLRLCHSSVNIPYLLAMYLRMFALGMKREAMISGGQFMKLDDTWDWVAPRPERQLDATAGALEVAEGAPDTAEGAQVIPAPVHAPQPPPTARPASLVHSVELHVPMVLLLLSIQFERE